MTVEMEEILSGFKRTGQWMDVVEFGEKISAALYRVLQRKYEDGESIFTREEYLEEFEEWRPKAEDKTGEISERTAEKASINQSRSEEKGKTVREDIADAQEEMKDVVDSASNLDAEETKENMNDSVNYTQRATDSFLRKCVRWFEENVYKYLMTKISPYYFDNQLLNANLNENRDGTFTLEVNISDDELYEGVKEELEVMDEESDVWRVETELNPEPAEAVDGVDNPSDTKTKEQLEESVDSELSEDASE